MRMNALGINARNLLGISPRNARPAIRMARDKVGTKSLLAEAGVPVPLTRAVLSTMWDLEHLGGHLAAPSAMKPAAGAGGGGILLVSPKGEGWTTPGGRRLDLGDVEAHAAHILHGGFAMGSDDRVLIEELLVPHPEVARLHGGGIADVRLIFVDGILALSMLRMPTRASDGKANLHQGAVGVGIDIATGNALRAVQFGQPITHHPDTDKALSELSIPHWETILGLASRGYEMTTLGYLGADIVLDKELGPLVLELNARPGLAIQVANGRGLAPRIEAAKKASQTDKPWQERVTFSMTHIANL